LSLQNDLAASREGSKELVCKAEAEARSAADARAEADQLKQQLAAAQSELKSCQVKYQKLLASQSTARPEVAAAEGSSVAIMAPICSPSSNALIRLVLSPPSPKTKTMRSVVSNRPGGGGGADDLFRRRAGGSAQSKQLK